MKAVNVGHYNIVLKREVWEHNVPPCSKSAVCLLANNESVVTWLSGIRIFAKDLPEFLVLFKIEHVCSKGCHFERAVNKIDTLGSTFRGMV